MKKNQTKMSNVVSINQDTGEILKGLLVYFGTKHNPYTKGWIVNSQEALELLASDEDLSKDAYKVLILLMGRLDFENWINVPQKEICEKLNINKGNISRAVSLLESKEIILREKKFGRSYIFRLNPYFAWKGKPVNLEKYRKEKEKERIKNLKNKTDKRKLKKLEKLSKEYNMSIEELLKLQNKLNLN